MDKEQYNTAYKTMARCCASLILLPVEQMRVAAVEHEGASALRLTRVMLDAVQAFQNASREGAKTLTSETITRGLDELRDAS